MMPDIRPSIPGRPDQVNATWLPWDQFCLWLGGRLNKVRTEWGELAGLPPPWKPGQHVALVGKTREGKTTFAVGMGNQRKYVLALDPKGEDETLSKSGWQRIRDVPPNLPRAERKEIERKLDEGQPVRLVLGRSSRTPEDDRANKALMAEGIEYVRQAGHWMLYVDEHQILSDNRMFKLGPDIARMAISAARDAVSVVVAMQYVSWVEKAPTRQSSLIVMWKSHNRDLIKAVADEVGMDWRDLGATVQQLPRYCCVAISDDIRSPMVITQAPELSARRAVAQ